jgi:uncharacterized protein YccT (UPF0319 family)
LLVNLLTQLVAISKEVAGVSITSLVKPLPLIVNFCAAVAKLITQLPKLGNEETLLVRD